MIKWVEQTPAAQSSTWQSCTTWRLILDNWWHEAQSKDGTSKPENESAKPTSNSRSNLDSRMRIIILNQSWRFDSRVANGHITSPSLKRETDTCSRGNTLQLLVSYLKCHNIHTSIDPAGIRVDRIHQIHPNGYNAFKRPYKESKIQLQMN